MIEFEVPAPYAPDPSIADPYKAARQLVLKIQADNKGGVDYTSADLYAAYEEWARRRELRPASRQAWAAAMKHHGMWPHTIRNIRMWMLP